MTALKIIEIYQTNPYDKGQGGGVRYVSNLFKIFSKTGQSVEFWGTGNKKDNQLNFFNIGGKNNYLIFWLRFINRFIFFTNYIFFGISYSTCIRFIYINFFI